MNAAKQKAATAARTRKRSQWRDVWKRLRRNKLAMIGMVLVILIVFSAIFADLISPYPYDGIDVTARMQLPSAEHLLGTDNFGRDLLSRIIYGGRISLLVACAAFWARRPAFSAAPMKRSSWPSWTFSWPSPASFWPWPSPRRSAAARSTPRSPSPSAPSRPRPVSSAARS